MPFSRRPTGVTSGRPPNAAATASGGQLARCTRPDALANAGVREPIVVTRRTGCEVSSLATNTE